MKGIPLSLVALGFACYATSAYGQADIPDVRLASPDGRLAITIGTRDFSTPLAARSQLFYSVELDGEQLITHSPIQLRLRGAPPIGGGMAIVDTMRRTVDEHSELAYGKTRYLHDFCNEYRILLQETDAPHRTIRLTARAYDDAVAFRLHLPRQPQLQNVAIEAEHTLLDLRPGVAHLLPFQNFRHPYENNYTVARTTAIEPATLIALPLLVHLDAGPWIAISAIWRLPTPDGQVIQHHSARPILQDAVQPAPIYDRGRPSGPIDGQVGVDIQVARLVVVFRSTGDGQRVDIDRKLDDGTGNTARRAAPARRASSTIACRRPRIVSCSSPPD